MNSGDSNRRATSSSEPWVDSDPDELVSELEFTLMTPSEAGLESREDGPDEWGDGEARGDKCGRARGTIRYGYIRQLICIHRKAEIIPVSVWLVAEECGRHGFRPGWCLAACHHHPTHWTSH